MNVEQLEVLFRRLVDEMYADGELGGEVAPMWRGGFRALQALDDVRTRRSQASYLHAHGTQTGEPATFARRTALSILLRRGGSRELALHIAPGKMTVTGPSGRLYVNVETIDYRWRDPTVDRTVRFECVIPGEPGNLDFLINDDLVTPAGTVPIEYLALADQSRGRANRGGSSTTYAGASAIKDSGIPSTFEAADEGLYVEVLDSSNLANHGRLLRIAAHFWPGTEEPPGSNVRPSYAALDDRAVREALRSAKLDDGGVFTTVTDQLNDPDAGTATLLPVVPVVGDAVYFGAVAPIAALVVVIDTAGAGDYAVTWQVWDGGAWVTPAGLVDGTQNLTVAGTRSVTVPSAEIQVATAVDGVTAYWLRASVSAFVSLTVQPVASYAYPLTYQPLQPDAGGLEWAVRDWKDLGFSLVSATQVELGRNDDLFFHGEQRGLYRVLGESEEAFRVRLSRTPDVVTPAALQRVVNRTLAPLKLKGVVFDTGDEFEGFFFDADAYDYYGPGDIYPQNQWKLLLSLNETYGYFFVRLPWIAVGDFGIFYDEGPLLYLPSLGLYVGPAYDDGFYDGKSYPGEMIYRSLYEELRRRKGGGTGFVLIPDDSLNAP